MIWQENNFSLPHLRCNRRSRDWSYKQYHVLSVLLFSWNILGPSLYHNGLLQY